MLKLLLDENLSPKVGEALCREGIDAIHIRDRGLLEAPDHRVLDKAFDEDRVLVTANVGDFVKLAQARELHAGIILIELGGLLRDEQLEVVRRACEQIGSQVDMANRMLRVAADLVMTFEEIPSPTKG